VAWPVAARAQQGERMRRIANLPADDPDGQARNAPLLQGLQQFGWTVGSNVRNAIIAGPRSGSLPRGRRC
jgi:putative tryptophan/tyrosine transport system substrate-binding protein